MTSILSNANNSTEAALIAALREFKTLGINNDAVISSINVSKAITDHTNYLIKLNNASATSSSSSNSSSDKLVKIDNINTEKDSDEEDDCKYDYKAVKVIYKIISEQLALYSNENSRLEEIVYQEPCGKGFDIKIIFSTTQTINMKFITLEVNQNGASAKLIGGNRTNNDNTNEYSTHTTFEFALQKRGVISPNVKRGVKTFVAIVRDIVANKINTKLNKETLIAENLKKDRELMVTFALKIISRMRSNKENNKPYNGIESVSDIADNKVSDNIVFNCYANKTKYWITIYSMPHAEYKIMVSSEDNGGIFARVIDRELLTTCSKVIDNIFSDIKNLPLSQICDESDKFAYNDEGMLTAIKGIYRLVLSELNNIENKSINDKNLNKDPMKIIIVKEVTLTGFQIIISDGTLFTSDRFVTFAMTPGSGHGIFKVSHCDKSNVTDTDYASIKLYLYQDCEIVSIIKGMMNMIKNMNPMAGDNGWNERNMKRMLTN
jgi:hypothetical protein